MALPVDNAGIEDVPLKTLPSGISSALRETAASLGTASGDSESVSEQQSTDANTATVNPEASAISLNHSQHNLVRRLTTKKSELVIIIIGTFIASAGLILSFRAYRLSKLANELTMKGNAVAENAYKLQLWDDCHNRQDLQNSNLCQSDSILDRRGVVVRKPPDTYAEPDKMVSSSGFVISYSSGYSSCGFISQSSHFGLQERSTPGPTDLWHWVGSALLNIFVCLVSCHVCYLFVLRDVPFGLNRAERRKKRSTERRALSSMSGLWVCAFAIHQIFLAVLSSLSTRLYDNRACTFVPATLLALYLVVDKRIQLLRQDSTIVQDEEAQGHGREEPDLRTLPVIGRETSVAYVQELKRRLRTYVYQQDN